MSMKISPTNFFNEKYRPQFHFTPIKNWMNDPNGMVYFQGEYHLFYQHHPESTVWGPMHWGHAVSSDMVHWEHLPIALFPDENGYIFSGSIVVDTWDSSGFFDGGEGLVAIFTHAGEHPDTKTPRQVQSLAYSTDKGRTWTKYEGNPVLEDTSIADFRDPKVIWYEKESKWIMVLSAGNHVRFYSSSDMKSWRFESSFGEKEGSHLGVWECPDLFQLPIEGGHRWVLIVSIGDDPAYTEGSRTQYFIGDFDGKMFTNENDSEKVLWLDFGRDNYAGVTWSNVPKEDGRRLFIGWMSNWKYANQVPTETWRSAMTLPRSLTLNSTREGIRLVQTPVQEISALRKPITSIQRTITLIPGENILKDIKTKTFELKACFKIKEAAVFGIKVHQSKEEETIIGYDSDRSVLYVDRRRSGDKTFHNEFSCVQEMEVFIEDQFALQIFVDTSSVEVFANDGKHVLTSLIFPREESNGLELFLDHGAVDLKSLDLFDYQSIWAIGGS
ncbi:fructan beta-fructosidase [Fictibacillus halophilus]|uniref:Fructan beta-fructosidase n=1 Tax=Fictibacillus halophilus TaxID=1610490 RepID=A0ABV2LHN2_9BACL|nr:glycoside hydrolase family 32 protein [Fictibacillus halophilus]